VDAAPLSQLDLARLKAKKRLGSAVESVTTDWRRPSFNPIAVMRWTRVALVGELGTWKAALPTLLRHDFAFTLALWVAVFSVAASVVAAPMVPLSIRYTAGLAAVAYLYLYVELSRFERPVPGRSLLLGIADLAVVGAIGALSVPYVPYARVLLFFAAARAAARWRDARILPAGLLMVLPFELTGHAAPLTMLFDAFLVLMTMVLVVHLMGGLDAAQQTLKRQSAMAALISGLARVRDEEALFAHLASQAPSLAPSCAWAFWTMDPTGNEYRAIRWAGLPEGEMPGFSFTLPTSTLPRDSSSGLTRSCVPTETPPEVTRASTSRSASMTSLRSASGSSGPMPSPFTSAPPSRSAASSAQRLESTIWPGPGFPPTSTSSSPVDINATRGRRNTGSRGKPSAAARPSSAGPSCSPADSTRSPARRSAPGA